MKSLSWWKDTFATNRDLWKKSLLEASRSEKDWNRAVRQWVGEARLNREAERVLPEGALAGVPFGVKDLFDQEGEVTLAGSILLERIGVPAVRDALILRRLRERGAVPVGRTNMNEFAYGLDGFNPHTGDCPHPKDPERISGGSSSGSAWIVAKGILPAALGTDTGGSVRVPAALCGVYGFRGLPDECARDGVFPLARSFDTTGWFTASGEDMLALLELLWDGESESEGAEALWYAPGSVRLSEECLVAYRRFLGQNRGVDGGSEAAERAARSLDSVIEEAFWAYNVIGSCEAFEVHRHWFSRYKERYNPDVWRLIDRSRHWESGALEYARILREEVGALLRRLLDESKAIMMPAVHTVAPRMSEVDQEFRVDIIKLTSLASLAGLPVLTIPLETSSGLSCGVQIITTAGQVLPVARRYLSGGTR
ncbi:MAG: amidase [Spirochaetaceae bacterium]